MSNTIDSLELQIISSSTSAVKGIDALTQSLGKLKGATSGLSSVATDIGKVSSATEKAANSSNKASKSFTDLFHALKTAASGFKTIGKAIYSAIDKSNAYTENIHLFSVAMGEHADAALTYAESVSNALGIDTSEWVRAQGVFMTISTGFGIASDRAALMSQNLTQLGYDLASFYNLNTSDAMDKLKSGLAGELEPLRAIGYDLSQAKLEAIALSKGIDKSVSSMTQAEKAQLRYYAIMTQVTTAQGDMARTLDQPANQIRVLKAQFEMAARSIGNIFIPALNAILPIAIAVIQVVRSLADIIAGLFGYEFPEVDYSGASAMSSAATDTSEAMDDATKSAKKLKSYMLGFDELNVLNADEGGGSSDANDASSGFDFALPDYSEKFLEGAANSRVSEIVESMKKWLGITEDIDSWSELFDTRLGKILLTVGGIGAAIALWKIGTGVYTAITSISGAFSAMGPALTAIKLAIASVSTPVLIVVGVIAALVAGLAAVYATNEEVRTSVNNAVKDIGEAFTPALTFITGTIIPDLKAAWNELIVILTPFGEWLTMVFTSIWMDMIVPALEWVANSVIPALTSTLQNLWNNVFVPLGTFLSSVFTPVVSILSELLTWLWQYVIVPLSDFVGSVFATAWEGLVKIFNEAVIPKINRAIEVCTFLWEKVLSPIVTFLWDVFSPAFKVVFEGISDIIGACKEYFTGLINFVTGVFTKDWEQAWEGVKTMFGGIWDGMKTLLKTPLNYMLTTIEGFVNKIIDGWNWLKKQINSLSIEIPEWLGGGTLGFNLGMSSHVSLPRFAEGGFPEQGQMFIAREAGAEMVGSIGRRTAVANNDQIVAGIAGGVAEANEEQNALLREQNSLLRALYEKNSGVYLDGKELTNSVEKYQRERGRVLITGGVV